MNLLRAFLFVVAIFSSSAHSEDLTELVREQLVYPRPLSISVPNPILLQSAAHSSAQKVASVLEREQLCTLQKTPAQIEMKPTEKGQALLVPVLNIANYQVSVWKIVLGEEDVEIREARDDGKFRLLLGRHLVVKRNSLYDAIFSELLETERRSISDRPGMWRLAKETGLLTEVE